MVNRRAFFLRALASAAGAALAWLGLPGRASAAQVSFALDKAPGLKKVGGQALLRLKEREILFVRDGESSLRAFEGDCPHERCKVAYDDGVKKVICPCHRSSFDLTSGKVLGGPSPRGLKTFPAEVSGNKVLVTLE